MDHDDQHHTYQNYPQNDEGYHHLMYEPTLSMPPDHAAPLPLVSQQEGIPESYNHDFFQYDDLHLMNASFPVDGSALNDFNEFDNFDNWGQVAPAWQLETADDGQGAHMDGPSSVQSSAMVQGLPTSAGSIHSNLKVSEGTTHQTAPEEEEGCDDDTEDADWNAKEDELDNRLEMARIKHNQMKTIQRQKGTEKANLKTLAYSQATTIQSLLRSYGDLKRKLDVAEEVTRGCPTCSSRMTAASQAFAKQSPVSNTRNVEDGHDEHVSMPSRRYGTLDIQEEIEKIQALFPSSTKNSQHR